MLDFIIIMRHFFIMIGAMGMIASIIEYLTEKKITRALAKAYRSDIITMFIVLIIGVILTICI